ncbi:heme/hemin ABC transporter substrate-binding protein [Mongoliitalea daihaiensis]|uniref:heme/hemin ABC transporter substrate-binding protein n=1 Tax=Mongoliitalea daihaiensis TaxID=2782006 RepID=UPI001F18A772|nr:ABC transporter substrate-binding protein [Mongoliitalea daihaiensis]UJP65651.1 ABC transporter substrate-binding protein [Mongoliitalea daihaiensis]
MIARFVVGFVVSALFACSSKQVSEEVDKQEWKLITAGGTVSEVVVSLGYLERIIATDITSTFPASLQQLPSIGYRNQIKGEGLMALGADMILAESGYLSEDVLDQLKLAGIQVKLFEKPTSIDGTYRLIQEVAAFLEEPEKGETLLAQVKSEQTLLEEYVKNNPLINPPAVAFIMARGLETVFLAGEETFASEIIQMAGGKPAGTGFKDFIPLTPEAIVGINPDYLLFFDSGLGTIGGKDGVQQIKGANQTKALQNGNILSFDGQYLSGFGPRVAQAALELAKAIRAN